MKTLEEKRIIIKLPQFHLRSLLSLRALLLFSILIICTLFTYWYQVVYPFLWIPSARVDAFSTLIRTDISGRIVQMGPQEGDYVKKGALLLALDSDLILAKQTQVKLSIDSLYGQIEKEKERIGKAMEGYVTALNDVEVGIGSPELAQKQLVLIEEAQEKIEQAMIQVGGAKNELASLDLQIQKMTFLSPFNGTVLKRSENEGSVVSFGDPLYLLCDPNRIWVEAEVPEKEINRIHIGSPVRISLPAYPDEEFNGKVTYISPATIGKSSLTVSKNENILIKASIEKGPSTLRPGLSAAIGLKVR